MRRPRREVETTAIDDGQSSDLLLHDDENPNSNGSINNVQSGAGLGDHNKCWRTILFQLVASSILLVATVLSGTLIFGTLGRTPQKFAVLDERCERAARHIKRQNIQLLALDFDLTVIDQHTGGRWKGTPEELSKHLRPEIQCLLNSAFSIKRSTLRSLHFRRRSILLAMLLDKYFLVSTSQSMAGTPRMMATSTSGESN